MVGRLRILLANARARMRGHLHTSERVLNANTRFVQRHNCLKRSRASLCATACGGAACRDPVVVNRHLPTASHATTACSYTGFGVAQSAVNCRVIACKVDVQVAMVNTGIFGVLDRSNATPRAGRARQPMLQSIRSLYALKVYECGKRAAELCGLRVYRELSTKVQP